ncbi:hypothetical protein TNCV_328181 [Trichonephila clavipes]|nr:hypothetical protein TNCV_328181 [Trichonephila clavipes]
MQQEANEIVISSQDKVEKETLLSEESKKIIKHVLCHTPGLALHTTVAGKCLSSPEDEQEKQGESRDRKRKTLHPAQKSYYAGDRF